MKTAQQLYVYWDLSAYQVSGLWRIVLLSSFCCFIITFTKKHREKKISNTDDETDFSTDIGRRRNITFRCKNTGYKNTWSGEFQIKVFLGLH